MGIEVAFDGRLGAAPQMRTTSSGQPWATFSVAVGRGDDAQWLSVSAFGDQAIELPDDLGKGEHVYVQGRLTVAYWEKAGEKRVTLRVAASRILVLDRIGRRANRRRRRNEAGAANGANGSGETEVVETSDAQTAGAV